MSKKFKGILLLSDMDGTMLNDEKMIPPRNIEAVKYFIENGGMFSIASGRTHQSVGRYLNHLPVNMPMIALNGTVLYDPKTEKILWHGELERKSVKNIIREVMRRFPDVGLEIYNGEMVHIVSHNSYTKSHMAREHLHYDEHGLDEISAPWYKALFAEENSKLKPIEQFIKDAGFKERYPNIRYVYSESYFYEVLGADISKGKALERLCDLYHIPKEKTFVVGDHHNDTEMMEAAGFSFAPRSAVEEIRKMASQVLCDNNEGVVADAVAFLDRMFE
jgi:Cof subfamily protein (haloacid dehalogenase superfamily)